MTTSSSVKNKLLPPGLVSNLEEVLLRRKGGEDAQSRINISDESAEPTSSTSDSAAAESNSEDNNSKPVILVTNAEGVESPGLVCLVEALVGEGLYNVHVCAPQSDKSSSGHALSVRETVAVTSAEIKGATAFEVSGTPVDCVSLALSGALFSWSKPILVISGINRGSSCGHHMLYKGVVAGAREAFISGVPSISISLNWKKNESQESDFKDAATVCLPLVSAAIRDLERGVFPKSCWLNIGVPVSPSTNKGFKITKQSVWRTNPSWQAISANRHATAARFMSNQQSLGMQLAQLGRDASAAGAARRLFTQRKPLEVVESVGFSGKTDSNRAVKYFRLELQFVDKEQEDASADLDFMAVESGFVSVTPFSLPSHVESDTQTAVANWISAALQLEQ